MIGALFTAGFGALGFETSRAQTKILKTLAIQVEDEDKVEGPLVSVIIPAYNEEKYLPGLLKALANQTYQPLELIVVDNVSDDRTIEIAQQYGATVLINEVEGIPNISRNIGLDNAHGEYLVFFDADTIPESGAIEAFVNALESADIVYPTKLSSDDNMYSSIRVALGWLDPNDWTAAGMCLAMRRQTLLDIGGWDETLDPTETKKEDGLTLVKLAKQMGYTVMPLRATYVAASDRRHHQQGLGQDVLWKERAAR